MTASAAHVLILEDDDGLLALASRVLRKHGHRVTAVAQSEAAREAVALELPDLLIVDYNLQALDSGLDFFRGLRAEGIGIPAIMVSGVSDELRIIEALRAGVADVLPKTSDYLDYLPEAVERVLQQLALQRQAEQATRLQAERMIGLKDEFVATLSHELRTPLNAILGWVQYLLRDASDPEQLRRGLEVIERNAIAQSQMVEELLDMSRILSGKLRMEVQRMDLAAVVLETIGTVQAAANAKEIGITTDLAAGTLMLGDPARLQQVVWNLLTNAIKFTPRQGQVSVTLHPRGDELELVVTDNGEGIEPAFLAHVFERFSQDNDHGMRNTGGLGLGLSIARQLVESHGGRMRAESAGHGQGASFHVVLPLLSDAASPSP
ncbi:ATP-binding protein [Herbaspirillum sp. NPDC087042]|uniref:hybrid sensor histidine kinase/response regulator n=1 Tax=Herbaspirillum sp. NPDC087042 TaxID=3364004 RepID=UPI0037F859B7